MGSETSRPLEAPQEFGSSGEQFQIISPVSDISCPSDIHRIYRNRHNHEIANPSLPTVVDANRQVSRTVAKKHSGQNPALHAPTRVSEGVPPPSHFYFPSKETERAIEEAERKARREANKENRRPRFFKKTKKIFKKTQIAMKGCFVEPPVDAQLEQQQLAEEAQRNPGTLGIDKNKQEIFSPTKVDRYLTTVTTSVPVIHEEPELEEEAVPKKKSSGKTKPSFVIREAEGFVEPEQYSKPIELPGNSATIDVGAALHHADDYFSRLSAGSAEASPYVENKAVQKLSSMLGKEDPDSPVSNLFEGRKSGGVASVLSRTVDSIIEENLDAAPATKANRQSISSVKSGRQSFGKPFVSPTSSMIRYQTAIGTIAATPGYYSVQSVQEDDQSDPVFADDSTDTSNVSSKAKQLQLVKAESPRDGDDSSSCLSYMRPNETTAQSAFRPRQVAQKEALQQVATLGPKKSDVEPKQKISKLESLFRPVLPTLSADDGSASGSYDPWEIRVTESAPCYLESGDFRTMALQARTGGTPTSLGNPQRPEYLTSPSLMSMDSQMVSPSMAQTMVSNQAFNNAGFLFASENDKPLLRNRKSDNSLFSINTLAARSRLSTRSNAKAVAIVPKTHALPSPSESSYKSNDRQVRFSLLDAVTDSASVALALRESIDVPTVESSSVSEKASISSGSMESILKPAEKSEEEVKPAQKQTVSFSADCSAEQETPERKGLWCSNGNGATPYKQGADLKKHTNSPYLRFQSAKTRFESYGTVDVHEIPEIQNKVSDLTDITSEVPQQSQPARLSEETAVTAKSVQSAPAGPVNWSYTIKDGNVTHVSPVYGGNADLPAKSPYLRFENAKTMFDKNADGGVKKVQIKKEVPYKSPRKSKAKQAIKSTRSVKSAGSVASKIEELNQRVVDAKIDRKNHRWTKSNPRKYTVVDSNAVRTRAIVNYKTTVVGLKAINTMAAAKFNTIPIDDDDSSVESYEDVHEHAVDDDASKLSVATEDMSKLTIGSATVATVRQEHAHTQVSQPNTIRMSEGTYSTTGSGLSNVRKQVFRSSLSVVSTSDSTTMSAILNKENATAYQFRPTNKSVKPEQQARFATADPSYPQKWRSLAAAAHQRDSAKKVAKPFNNRGLSVRNMNTQPIAAGFYEC